MLAFRRTGDTAKSREALRAATEQNPYVPGYVLGEKKLPRHLPDYIGFGDEAEAIAYAASFGRTRTPPGGQARCPDNNTGY